MKVEPRAALYALLMGAGATVTLILLAVTFPIEGFLVLLFPSLLLWFLIPFLLLHLWRRLTSRRD